MMPGVASSGSRGSITHQYSRENGWAVAGLIAYYNVTNDKAALDVAERTAAEVGEGQSFYR